MQQSVLQITRVLISNENPLIRVESIPRDCMLLDVLMNLYPLIVILRTSAIEKTLQIETNVSFNDSESDNMLKTIVDDATH